MKKNPTHLLESLGFFAANFNELVAKVEDKNIRTQLWALFREIDALIDQEHEMQWNDWEGCLAKEIV